MKKIFLTLSLVGLLAVSCGQKKEENKDVKSAETTEQTTEAPQQKELSYSLEWTAFKTPAKVGVKGSFDDIKLLDVNKNASSLAESLTDAKFIVVTSSVNSKDTERDGKLKAEFFANMVGNINGSFGTFKDGVVKVNLTMNGITKEKEFKYTATDSRVKINGSIDILADFTADKAFNSLHEACKALHEGKTWSDVEIAVEIKK
jgi:hypothetical protein